MHNPDTPAPMD